MKITIEPTEDHPLGLAYPTVAVSIPGDDLTADEALALAKIALVAWGYPSLSEGNYE